MRYAQGTTAPLTVTVTNEHGVAVTADSVVVDIYGPDNQKVDDGVGVEQQTGLYEYDYAIPEDALVGVWRAEWEITYLGMVVHGDDIFEVGAAPAVMPGNEITSNRLRELLGEEKLAGDDDGSGTFFTDTQIADLLEYANDDLNVAAWEGWKRKMARYARLVDISESGSNREMSQKFKHAQIMEKVWAGIVGDIAAGRSAALQRVVGRSVNLGAEIDSLALLTPFSGYADHIREYPTHRLLIPAVLG